MSHVLIILIFSLGYFAITIEHVTKLNKTAIALLMAILCWSIQFFSPYSTHEGNIQSLSEHLASVSQIVLFLLSALIIVETINVHKGFQFISKRIRVRSKRKMLWLIGVITFFLSSVLDNLTTTVVMIVLLRKLTDEGEERLLMGGTVVIAANAGGAWTPIGDVTTTMLWIDGQLSSLAVMRALFFPSLVCLIASLAILTFGFKGNFSPLQQEEETMEPLGLEIFWLGVFCLISVPIFKIVTGLPPYMGMLLGLGILWLFTDIVHRHAKNRKHLLMPNIISKIDLSGVLFFLGILLAIDSLDSAGLLQLLAEWMDRTIGNSDMIAIAIGLASAVVDNVPLVAATMGMYNLSQYPPDSNFWNLIAFCAGTGGSILVIGSAAGVAFMGLEKVYFFWYMRRVGVAALVGYFAGILAYKAF